MHCQLEYFYFDNSEGEEMGIEVEASHHEVAFSQHEVNMKYAGALTMADRVMTYKAVVRLIAVANGLYAIFMPKPVLGINGSGMHVYQSLYTGDRDAFFDVEDPYHLSRLARQFLAGLVRHAPEITAVTCQWVNSYRRLVPGYEAPAYISWGAMNRFALARVPEYRPGKEAATRIEFRFPDPACNPYLVFSVMLAAGLKGIEKEYELPQLVEVDVYRLSDDERRRRGIATLPGSLVEAFDLMEESGLVRECLGEHLFYSFIRNKRAEWDAYRAQVTE